mgnify:CR=1 FL=1
MNEQENKIIDKIEKLLALAGSDNENEAKNVDADFRVLFITVKPDPEGTAGSPHGCRYAAATEIFSDHGCDHVYPFILERPARKINDRPFFLLFPLNPFPVNLIFGHKFLRNFIGSWAGS